MTYRREEQRKLEITRNKFRISNIKSLYYKENSKISHKTIATNQHKKIQLTTKIVLTIMIASAIKFKYKEDT